MLPPRDFDTLKSITHYYTLTRAQVTRLHFPGDDDGRITRKRLQHLLRLGLISKTQMQVVNPVMGAPAPVFFPTRDGVAYLVQETEEDRWKSACTQSPNWQHLYHWVAVAETHIVLDRAVEKLPGVRVPCWLGEWSVANPDEQLPEKRFTLYSLLSETPRLVCIPDAGFLLEKDAFRKVFYLEQDRDTTKNAERVAAQKAKGFAALFEKGLHKKHFPETNVAKFSVLVIAPTAKRRDALRKAFSRAPNAWLYKFAALTDLRPETFLTEPVFHPCEGDAAPLLVKGGST